MYVAAKAHFVGGRIKQANLVDAAFTFENALPQICDLTA
jgi:hypothetical protein